MTESLSLEDAHYMKVMFLTCVPVALFVLGGFFAFFSCNAKCKGWSFSRWMRHTIVFFTIPMFIAWPSILIGLVQAVTCVDSIDIEDNPVRRLKYHPSILCDSQEYEDSLYMYVLPGIGVWLVLYPLITSCCLGWRFKGIYNPPTVPEGEEEEAIKKLQRKVRNTKFYYGFFIVGLKNGITNQLVARDRWWNMDPIKNVCVRILVFIMIAISIPVGYLTGRGRLILVNNFASVVSSFYYWEFYTYFVKALLVVVMAMFNVSRHLRLLTAIVILGIYTSSTLASEPYQSRKLNYFNSASVLVVLFYALLKLVVVDVTPNPIPGID